MISERSVRNPPVHEYSRRTRHQTGSGADVSVLGAEAARSVRCVYFSVIAVRADQSLQLRLHSCDHLVPEALLLAGHVVAAPCGDQGNRLTQVPVRAASTLSHVATALQQSVASRYNVVSGRRMRVRYHVARRSGPTLANGGSERLAGHGDGKAQGHRRLGKTAVDGEAGGRWHWQGG